MREVIKLVANMDPNNLNENQNFFIHETIVTAKPNATIQPLHRHPFYELIFVLKGQGTMQIDFIKNMPMHAGALYFLSPSQVHLPLVEGDFDCFVLRFDLSVFSDKAFFENLSIFNFDYLMVEEPSYTTISHLISTIYTEFIHDNILKQCSLSNLLRLLLIYIQRLLPDVVNAPLETSHFNALNQLMSEHHYKIMQPSEYAKELKTPIKTLNNAVKEYTGLTCGEYIRSKTLVEAKRLLLYTDKNASEVAYELGFVDTAYFNRFFKRETGLTPIKFKKSSL
ncbi:MAG: AraC family transcriptional regulator [Sulfurospirillaceae bacterium]|nr:AraC family transcriptional regulator [Sulfurospirillaceae bacterium]